MSNLVRAPGLRFAYGESEFALSIDALSIDSGQHTVVIGPSGCGKTTLAHLLAGILSPDAGEIEVAGAPIQSLADGTRRAFRLEQIGMVFQQFELLDYLTALENILLPFHLAERAPTATDNVRALMLAERMGVAHTLSRRPEFLSQGERQRVAICRALVVKPQLVICDEPTGNLDPASKTAAMDLLFEQVAADGATLMMVTHDHDLLSRFAQVIDLGAAR